MENNVCAIWGTPAKHEPRTGDFSIIKSDRAGGIKYHITGTAITECESLDDSQRALLTSEVIDLYISGVETPKIDSNVLAQAKNRKPLKYSQKVERFFRWLNIQNFQPGFIMAFWGGNSHIDIPQGRAWIEDKTDTQLEEYVRILAEDGYLFLPDQSGSRITSFRLTTKGCERLEQLHALNGESTQAFVAMWFNAELKDAFEHGIREAILASGYDPMRIDSKEHSNKVDDEIISEIRRSRFVIADFTSGFVGDDASKILIARGGVYYEAGFAQGLGIPVIWTCREDCLKHVHFDTRQFNHVVWTTPDDLKYKLTNRIGAVIGWGPNAKR